MCFTWLSSGKIGLLSLVLLFLGTSCVTTVPEQAGQPVPNSEVQSGPVLVQPPQPESPLAATENQPVQDSEPVEETPRGTEPASGPVVEVFDPANVSAEVKELTFADVKRLIQNLNTIIQTRNYELWITNLTEDYLNHWSDPETLARLSESPVLRRQNITLTTLRDYFVHVVYPSRQNDRVDDIEFIGETRIKAIIINPKGERLVLYNLEKIDDTWKIANWR